MPCSSSRISKTSPRSSTRLGRASAEPNLPGAMRPGMMAAKAHPVGARPMSRFLSLAEAVQSNVRDGDTVAMEGFTHLIPHAAGHEIIRQQRKHLTLIRMTPDLIYDQMIGMGCARKLIFSWGGNPGVGSLHRFRDAVEKGWP